jgi:hypothetical protein
LANGPVPAGAAAAPPTGVPPPIAVPQINDAYWFSYSKTVVDRAIQSRDDAAEKLQTYVAWLWTVYTLGASVGFALGKLSLDFWPAILVSSPVLALVIVYWMTVWVRVPVLCQFDPRIPEQIEKLYSHNLLLKQRRLKLTLVAAAAAALLVSCALFCAATISTTRQAPFIQTIVRSDKETKELVVSGYLGDATKVALTLYAYKNKQRGDIVASDSTTVEGGFFHSRPIPLSKLVSQQSLLIDVTATLNSGGPTITASKVIDLTSCDTNVCD